jgi:hypothetical protein
LTFHKGLNYKQFSIFLSKYPSVIIDYRRDQTATKNDNGGNHYPNIGTPHKAVEENKIGF